MGEDSCRNTPTIEKKPSNLTNGDFGCSRQHHTTSISSCSEADSESTNTCCGDTTMEDEENEQDYQYGPGIVSKLRTKFLSITMKQSRGMHSNMRRSCSLENILEPKDFSEHNNLQKRFVANGFKESISATPWSNLKRAKSMDTLLLTLEAQGNDVSETDSEKALDASNTQVKALKEPKLIRRKDGPLNRPNVTICDEELPKPDTVKTYKRMFEPAESKKASINSNVRRRPPVLRASAKSVSSAISKNGSQLATSKMNGVSPSQQVTPSAPSKIVPPKPKLSAKESIPKDATPIHAVRKPCPNNVQRDVLPSNETSDHVEDQVKIMNLKNTNESQQVTNADLKQACSVVKEETTVKRSREGALKRNLRAPKYLEGTDTKPAIPLNKPQLKKIPIKTAIVQISDQKVSERPTPLINELKQLEKPGEVLSNKKVNGIHYNSKKVSPKIVEKFNPDLIKNVKKVDEDPEAFKCIHIELKKTKIADVLEPTKDADDIEKPLSNGFVHPDVIPTIVQDIALKDVSPPPPVSTNCVLLPNDESKDPPKKVPNGNVTGSPNSMVFDFRGTNVVSHVAVQPAPFGCKAVIVSKKRNLIIDGKESVPYLNGYANGSAVDDEDDDFVDYSVPEPCGLVFEGENIRVGKGALLSTRNKDLKIHFDDDTEKNTFVYPSESSLLTDESDLSSLEAVESSGAVVASSSSLSSTSTKLRTVPSICSNGTSSSLMSYTPSVLRTVDNIQPGLYRAHEKEKALKKAEVNGCNSSEGEQENRNDEAEGDDGAMLKPADPEYISSWSLSANTSDLLF